MQTDLDTLKQRVIDATKHSAGADQVEDVALEPDRDEWGTDFLRVVVQVKNIEFGSMHGHGFEQRCHRRRWIRSGAAEPKGARPHRNKPRSRP